MNTLKTLTAAVAFATLGLAGPAVVAETAAGGSGAQAGRRLRLLAVVLAAPALAAPTHRAVRLAAPRVPLLAVQRALAALVAQVPALWVPAVTLIQTPILMTKSNGY